MKTTVLILLCALVVLPLTAQQFGQVGTTGAQLLKINFDPRTAGLGNAGASLVSNAASVYTNVAGLEGIKEFDVAFSYTPWFADFSMASLAAAYRIPEIGVIGVQATGFSTDEEITTIAQENGTGERYTIRNLAFGLSFARHITDRLAIGIQGKYYYESYYSHSTGGFAFDIGSVYDLGFTGARLAMSLQHFGPDLPALSGSYADYSDGNIVKNFSQVPLPVNFRVSFTIEPIVEESYRLRLVGDMVHPNDNVEHYNIGGEVVLFDAIAVRGGLKVNYDDEDFALGVGLLGEQLLGQNLRLDYSFEQFTILSSVHKVSLGYAF